MATLRTSFTGTTIVNPDCTGSDTIQVFQSGVLVRTTALHLVYDDDGREARAAFTSLVLPDGTSLPSIITIKATEFIREEIGLAVNRCAEAAWGALLMSGAVILLQSPSNDQ